MTGHAVTAAPTVTGGEHWEERAACRGPQYDPDDWFALNPMGVDRAVTVCRTACPVIQECLVFALRTGQPVGVWGGVTDKERRRMARRHATEEGS